MLLRTQKTERHLIKNLTGKDGPSFSFVRGEKNVSIFAAKTTEEGEVNAKPAAPKRIGANSRGTLVSYIGGDRLVRHQH